MLPRKLACFLLIAALLQTACAKSEGAQLAEAAARGEYAYKQYKTADYVTAKAALLDFIEFLKELLASPSAESKTYSADIMVSYARLAKLEETHGGADKEKYMAEAARYCERVGFKNNDCSYGSLRKAVDTMDAVPIK